MWDNFIIPAPRFPGSTGIRRHYTQHPITPLNAREQSPRNPIEWCATIPPSCPT